MSRGRLRFRAAALAAAWLAGGVAAGAAEPEAAAARRLGQAIRLNERMQELFWDDKGGGFFLSPVDGETLLVRPKEIYDGALPSGNSIALYNLLRLERYTANPDLGAKAKLLIQAFSKNLQEVPSGYTQFLSGLSFALAPPAEVVIVGDPEAADTRAMLSSLQRGFFPHIVALNHPSQMQNSCWRSC